MIKNEDNKANIVKWRSERITASAHKQDGKKEWKLKQIIQPHLFQHCISKSSSHHQEHESLRLCRMLNCWIDYRICMEDILRGFFLPTMLFFTSLQILTFSVRPLISSAQYPAPLLINVHQCLTANFNLELGRMLTQCSHVCREGNDLKNNNKKKTTH